MNNKGVGFPGLPNPVKVIEENLKATETMILWEGRFELATLAFRHAIYLGFNKEFAHLWWGS